MLIFKNKKHKIELCNLNFYEFFKTNKIINKVL